MKIKEFKLQLLNKSYLEVYLISGNRIIDTIYEHDIGQRWLISKKTNRAFIIPDRTEGLLLGQKTIFFFSSENSTPLSIEHSEEIEQIDSAYIYGINSENKFLKLKNRLLKNPENLIKTNNKTQKIIPSKIVSTTIEPAILKSIINTKIIEDLLKPNENIWEQLKIPIIVGIIAITIIGITISI